MKPRTRLSLQILFVLATISSFHARLAPAQKSTPKAAPSEPAIDIKLGPASDPIQEHPGKQVKIKVTGTTAQLIEFATDKPIGKELSTKEEFIPKEPNWRTQLPFKITCWAFSPDGKFIAIGSGHKKWATFELDVNIGKICVWEISSRKLVASRGEKDGTVKAVAFSKDGKSVLVEAEEFVINGL